MLFLYDLSAAFDTVSHATLVKKIEIYGFQEKSLSWMRSYLENRQQSVTVQKLSKVQEMKLGTPQGSRLSPLAFVIFMADLDLHVSGNCQISQFADDTQTLCVSDSKESVVAMSTREATNVINFFSANDLVNNPDKACVVKILEVNI